MLYWFRVQKEEDKLERIAIDMDEVIADYIKKQLKLYNQTFNEVVKVEDLRGLKLRQYRPESKEKLVEFLQDPSFFTDLEVLADSQEVIRELNEDYDIYITTAAMEYPTSFTAKYNWLKEHFPFLDDQKFVFCGNKSIIHADYLIDDNVKHFPNFIGKPLLFTAPHNINITAYTRLNNWKEVRSFFLDKK